MFTDISLQSMELQQYDYSVQAVASVVAARKAKGICPEWSPRLEEISGYCFGDVEGCFKKLYTRFEKIMSKKNHAKRKSQVGQPSTHNEYQTKKRKSKPNSAVGSTKIGSKTQRDSRDFSSEGLSRISSKNLHSKGK